MKMKISKITDSKELVGHPVLLKEPLKWTQPLLVLFSLILLWIFAPSMIRLVDDTAGSIDQSIWLLVLLSLICFMLLSGLCWWMLQRFWLLQGLPSLPIMVSQFYTLSIWQQICLLWASFALLILASLATLFALC
ncbi:hypothetical protein [Pedobacter gandavensis]|uniref:hypothetical protein n=1 Tax=Pedobacter gandavensis TaxID=2679963 RepID=UPI0029314F9F|nr:hypothetical protein [Pedobacter gandavensis]